ncbi:MAG: TetR/AcrR family transcriptional regulator [Oscillospiraceae bacterium]
MGKLDENKKHKRESLLETAFRLFMSQGINNTSISDIADQAGVAKGTFYLYFKDKYDINNKLICHKSSQLFRNAAAGLDEHAEEASTFEDTMIYIIDSIINQLSENPNLLKFIAKNLSWGIFKNVMSTPVYEDDIDFSEDFRRLLKRFPERYDDPEIMLFMIVELVSSTCYSAILYSEPVDMETLKPYLYRNIRSIICSHRITSEETENV